MCVVRELLTRETRVVMLPHAALCSRSPSVPPLSVWFHCLSRSHFLLSFLFSLSLLSSPSPFPFAFSSPFLFLFFSFTFIPHFHSSLFTILLFPTFVARLSPSQWRSAFSSTRILSAHQSTGESMSKARVLFSALLYFSILHCTPLCSSVPFCTLLYFSVLFCANDEQNKDIWRYWCVFEAAASFPLWRESTRWCLVCAGAKCASFGTRTRRCN